jgi:hypothetical protein
MLFGSMQIVVSKYSPGDFELENSTSHEWVMPFLIAFLFCLGPSDESDGRGYLCIVTDQSIFCFGVQ